MSLSYLIVSLCLFQVFISISADTYKCKAPNQDVIFELENQYGLDISNVDQDLTYDYKDYLVDPSFDGYTSLVFDNIKVKFAGYLLPKGQNADVTTMENFNTKKVEFRHQVVNKKNQCTVVEVGFVKPKEVNPKKIAIHKLTVNCLEEFICKYWYKFIAHDSRVKRQYESTINQIFKKNSTAKKSHGQYDIQSTWNSLFDIGKTVAMDELFNDNGGVLVLPDLQQNFRKLLVDGSIYMKDIRVEGLRTLKRTKDIAVNRYKNRYDFSTGIQLKNVQVKIPNYIVKYGFTTVNGHITVSFAKLGISVKVHVDYNSQPCEIIVDELKKDSLEGIKIDFTGLSTFNWVVEEFGEYYLKNNLVDEVRKSIESKIKKLNCSKYRTAVESVKF